MTMTTLSLGLWLRVALVASPWAQPVCTDPSEPPVDLDATLGSFDTARDQLESAVMALQLAHGRRQRDLDAEQRAEDALDHLRFHPRELALDPRAKQLRSQAMALLADQIQGSDPERARTWAYCHLSRLGVGSNVHEFAFELGADVELLYSRAQKDIDIATPAMIRINCDSRCTAFVDGESVSIVDGYAEVELVPGLHDVWVFDDDRPDHGQFEEIELDAGQQRCVLFSAIGQALPSRDEWWAASMYAHGLRWALSCKSNVPQFPPQTLEHVVGRWTQHTLVLSRSRSLRKLLVRGALNFADLWVVSMREDGDRSSTGATEPIEAESEPAPRDAVLQTQEQAVAHDSEDEAAEAIDMALRMSRFDAGNSATKVAGLLPSISAMFARRSRLAEPRDATISVICHSSCWPTIMGVRVEQGEHAVAPGLYYVEVHSVAGDEPAVGRWLSLDAGAREVVSFGPEPEPAPLMLAPLDAGASFDQRQQFRRVAFGTAGAVSLTGGALWTVAIAAGMIPNHKVIATAQVLDRFQRQRLALYMTSAFSIHAILATYLFVRMPPSQRPGMPLVAAGGGLVASSGFFAGIAVAGGVTAHAAHRRIENGEGDPDVLTIRERSGMNTLIVGAATAGALLVSGSVTLGVGRHRARRSEPLPTARVRARSRVSNLRLSPSFGWKFSGLRLSGKF